MDENDKIGVLNAVDEKQVQAQLDTMLHLIMGLKSGALERLQKDELEYLASSDIYEHVYGNCKALNPLFNQCVEYAEWLAYYRRLKTQFKASGQNEELSQLIVHVRNRKFQFNVGQFPGVIDSARTAEAGAKIRFEREHNEAGMKILPCIAAVVTAVESIESAYYRLKAADTEFILIPVENAGRDANMRGRLSGFTPAPVNGRM
jgi:hypothetical protein